MSGLADAGAGRQPVFASFFMGGFEGSSHRRKDGRQLDVLAASGHDARAAEDYGLLRQAGVATVRDALRWHRIEAAPGRYDWSSFLPMLRAARDGGTQVIWDLCHYGLPHDIDVFAPAFVDRFAAFARAAARLVRDEVPDVPFWCPVNEVSFWAWTGGDEAWMHPFARGRGWDLKCQLVRAAVAATHAAREVDPRARFMQAEPVINIIGHPDRPQDAAPAEAYRLAQYQCWDMLAGRLAPELGGSEDCLDVVGTNFYFNNQWVSDFETMGMGHRLFRPFADMLREVHERYGRPIVVSETGAEGANGPGWLRYVGGEVRTARRAGVPVHGICLYPVLDYPGWDDDRHCPCGLLRATPDWQGRTLDAGMVRQVAEERMLLTQEARDGGVPVPDGASL